MALFVFLSKRAGGTGECVGSAGLAKVSFNFDDAVAGSVCRAGMGTCSLHFMQVIISAVTNSEIVILFPHCLQVTMMSAIQGLYHAARLRSKETNTAWHGWDFEKKSKGLRQVIKPVADTERLIFLSRTIGEERHKFTGVI